MSNNILVITSNPEKDSMTDAVGAAFAAGAVERGASADVLDLYDEGFNPVYSAADRAHYLGHAPMPEDVVPIQRRLAQADVIALVFPIYWYTMPAMVKGLFDRVICRGFAYHPDGTPGALADKIAEDFGSFANFKAHFAAAAKGVEGSGWGLLHYRPEDGRLLILQAENQQKLSPWGSTPIS